MKIYIEQIFNEGQFFVKISKSEDFKNEVWGDLKRYLINYQNNALKDETNDSITVEWISLLSILVELKRLRDHKKFSITYSKEAFQKIEETIKNSNLINSDDYKIKITTDDIARLKEYGFSKIKLNKYQVRDLKTLLKFSNGANFSVQGSGKTAVTLATHLILKNLKNNPINSLIVVAPKNAFLGWEDGFEECLDENCELRKEGLVELTGSHELIKKKIQSGKKNFIINYEKLETMGYLIANFVYANKVHFVLDESHKIKSEGAQRSQNVLNLSHSLNFVRKDILTGTPAPNNLGDINTQYQFLYPGPDYDGGRFWVRTTKRELDLPKTIVKPINVDMTRPQLDLYTRVLNPFIASLKSNINIHNKFKEIRRSIIRLIQLSSNPVLVTRKQEEEGNIIFGDNMDSSIHQALVEEENSGGSAKIREACRIARKLAKEGKKTIIWSYFKHNIEFIGHYLLRDLNAEFIHGGVDMGDDDSELNTRKNKIKKFKDVKSDCMTLVANYASCAEGISLHHACHNAIYIDRSFQADQYLQSIDRICRLGNNDQKNIYILQCKTPASVGKNIDILVANALQTKIDTMGRFLNDPDLTQMSIDESRGEAPIDNKISQKDLEEIVNYFVK